MAAPQRDSARSIPSACMDVGNLPALMARNLRAPVLLALLTLAGFALHTAWLADRPLWLDEGFTIVRISNPWRALFTGAINLNGVVPTIDTHPPLYFALLKLWTGAVGTSDFALKYFSAAAGALAVPQYRVAV